MQNWYDEIREKFDGNAGADARAVFDLLDALADKHGVHLLDVHPGNIKFRGE